MKILKYLSESPTFALITVGQDIHRQVQSDLDKYELSLLESLILVSLFFEEEKGATPSQLHKTFKRTKGNISHCTSHLEERKLIKRSGTQGDRRGYVFHLTPKGNEISIQLVGYFDKLQRKMEAAGEKQVHTFLESLKYFQLRHTSS